MINRILRIWFRKSGWIFTGSLPKRLTQCLFVAGPHTRSKDFFLANAIMALTHYRTGVLVDEVHFTGIKGMFLRHLGAVCLPSDVNQARTMLSEAYKAGGHCSFVFTPMRKHKKSGEWSALFYELSLEFNLPIVPVGVDHSRRRIKFHSYFNTSIDPQRDVDFLQRFFRSFPVD